MTYLHIIVLVPSLIPSQIPHTLFDIISLGVDAVLCYDQYTCEAVHTWARNKCLSVISWRICSNFPWLLSRQQYVDRQGTIDKTVPLPERGLVCIGDDMITTLKGREGKDNMFTRTIRLILHHIVGHGELLDLASIIKFGKQLLLSLTSSAIMWLLSVEGSLWALCCYIQFNTF